MPCNFHKCTAHVNNIDRYIASFMNRDEQEGNELLVSMLVE